VADSAELKISFDTAEALKSLKTLERNSTEAISKIGKSFDTLKTVAAAALAFAGSRAVANFFSQGIESAVAQEKALARLNLQLEATGEAGAAASKQFEDLANEIEATSRFQDDAVLSAAALAKAYGLTNDQALSLTRAAADLAAATGDSLEGAVQSLTNSYAGNVKELGKLIPEIRGLTKEQLASGAAIDLVAKRFEGAARGEVETFAGAIIRVQNSVSNLAEAFGQAIIESGSLREVFKTIADSIAFIQGGVDNSRSSITGAINSLISFTLAVASVLTDTVDAVFKAVSRAIEGIARLISISIEQLRKLFNFVSLIKVDAIDNAFKGAAGAVENFADGLQQAEKNRDTLAKNFEGLQLRIAKAGETATDFGKKTQAANIKAGRSFVEAAKDVKDFRDEAQKFVNDTVKASLDGIDKIRFEERERFAELEKFYKQGALSAEDFAKARIAIEKKAVQDIAKVQEDERKKTGEAAAGFIGPLATGISQGAEGAAGFITSSLAQAGDLLLPGIGQAVKPLLDLFAQGPEATKAAVQGFVEAIPLVIDAIAESIPVFVETLVDVLITKGGAVRIGVAIAKAIAETPFRLVGTLIGNAFGIEAQKLFNAQRLGTIIGGAFQVAGGKIAAVFQSFAATFSQGINQAFVQGLENLAAGSISFVQTFVQTILSEFGRFFAQLFSFVASLPNVILNGIRDGILAVGDAILNFFQGALKFEEPAWIEKLREILNAGIGGKSGLGGAGGAISSGFQSIRRGLGFANGGIFEGPDTALTLTRPDEMLLNPRQQSNLFRQLNSGTGASDASLPILVKIASLLEAGMTVETDINIGSDKLATAILNLNRRNARLGV
jgi:phage-related protein